MGELSGYRLIRTGGLVVLTLVATTLPADAVSPAPAGSAEESPSENEAPGSDQCPEPAPAAPVSSPESTESPVDRDGSQGAGSPELPQEVMRFVIWSGRDLRCSLAGAAPTLLADLRSPPRLVLDDPFDCVDPVRIESPAADARSHRRWMACRNAHAPPVG